MKRRDVNKCVQENAMPLKSSWHENYLHLWISLSEFLLPPATPSSWSSLSLFPSRASLFPLPPPDKSQLEGATFFPVLVHSLISPFRSGDPFQAQVSLLMTVSASGSRKNWCWLNQRTKSLAQPWQCKSSFFLAVPIFLCTSLRTITIFCCCCSPA